MKFKSNDKYYEIKKRWREQNRDKQLRATKLWNKRHPDRWKRHNYNEKRTTEQIRAWNYVQNHRNILNSECEFCGTREYLCGHHLDYKYLAIVVTACHSCHKWIHGD